MGEKNNTAVKGSAAVDRSINLRQLISLCIIGITFLGYTLTFLVPKFYGLTDKYVGVFVFLMLAVLLLVNVNLIQMLKEKDVETIVMMVLLVLIGVNILIVNSGKGAFFVLADFILVFYLSDKVKLTRLQLMAISGAYLIMLFVWLLFVYPNMFAAYESYGYNTNTAATFTIYTLLCALVVVMKFRQRVEIVGLFIVLLLVKGVQLALYHRARGALLMLTAFLLFYYVIPKKWWLNKKVFRVLTILATFGSLLFVGAYTVLGFMGYNYVLPIFYKKIFSGREKIWREFFYLFIKKPITGIGTNLEITTFQEFNVHNAMYNILVVYGIVAFAGVLFFVFRRLEQFRQKALVDSTAFCVLCAIMAVFFESFFDVDLLWVDYAFNLLFLMLVAGNSFVPANDNSNCK